MEDIKSLITLQRPNDPRVLRIDFQHLFYIGPVRKLIPNHTFVDACFRLPAGDVIMVAAATREEIIEIYKILMPIVKHYKLEIPQ